MAGIVTQKASVLVTAPRESLGVCLERMEAANVGSILVVDRSGRLMSILTERDLIKNWRKLSDPGFMGTPIGTLATRPVFTLTVDKLATAAREMITRRIRHIPVVDAEEKVVGVISMRDILAANLRMAAMPRTKQVPITEMPECTAHLLTPTGQVTELCKRALPPNWDIKTWSSVVSILKLPELNDEAKLKHCAFVLDLDGVSQGNWKAIIARFVKLLSGKSQPAIYLISSPGSFGEKDRAALKVVATKARWFSYARPLPVAAFAADLGGINSLLGVKSTENDAL